MKRQVLTPVATTVAIIALLLVAGPRVTAQTLTDFYTYTEQGSGYRVELTDAFKAQLNLASGGQLVSGDYTWSTGDPLPNPAPDGQHDGRPVTSMRRMFSGCSTMTSLDLSQWDTHNVTDMYRMLGECSSLVTADLSNFVTSRVTNMWGMLGDCSALRSLDFTHATFEASPNVSDMFAGCGVAVDGVPAQVRIGTQEAYDWIIAASTGRDESQLTFVLQPESFYDYTMITYSHTEGFNAGNYPGYQVSLSSHFKRELNKASGGTLTVGDVTWRTGDPLPNPCPDGMYNGVEVVSLNSLFYQCTAKSLDLTNFTPLYVRDMSSLFSSCRYLTSLKLPTNFGTSNLLNMQNMFVSLRSLKSLDVTNRLNTYNVTNFYQAFAGCDSLEVINGLETLDTQSATTFRGMFYSDYKLKQINVSKWNTQYVSTMREMFWGCTSLTRLDLTSWECPRVQNTYQMFYRCHEMSVLLMPNACSDYPVTANGMFSGCNFLSYADLSKFTLKYGSTYANIVNGTGASIDHQYDTKGTFVINDANTRNLMAGTSNAESVNFMSSSDFANREAQITCEALYSYTAVNGGYQIAPKKRYKAQLLASNGQSFYACRTLVEKSNALAEPSPTRDGKYNGSNIVSLASPWAENDTIKQVNVDFAQWGTTATLTNTAQMFKNCTALQYVTINNLKSDNITDTHEMFYNCSAMRSINMPSTNFQNITNNTDMFTNCGILLRSYQTDTIPVSILYIPNNITSQEDVNRYTSTLTVGSGYDKRRLSFGWNSPPGAFYSYVKTNGGYIVQITNRFLEQLIKKEGGEFTSINYIRGTVTWRTGDPLPVPTVTVVSMEHFLDGLLYGDTLNLDFSLWDTSHLKSIMHMVASCSTLKHVSIKGLDTDSVTNMQGVFYNSTKLESITGIENWNTSNVENMKGVFQYCTLLKDFNPSKWNTGAVTTMHRMFFGAKAVTSLDLSRWNTARVTTMGDMFREMPSVTKLDLSGFTLESLTSYGRMFANCGVSDSGTPLTTVYVKDDDVLKTFTVYTATDTQIDSTKLKFAVKGSGGDVNGDGIVDITDVNITINCALGKDDNTAADVNGDGIIDITDVNLVINSALGK